MKKGISLIVLVITIIVMIILAAGVVITLSNTGVINRASQAVNLTDEKSVQDLAALLWAEHYLDGDRNEDLVRNVTAKLEEQGVTVDKWNVEVSNTGIVISSKSNIKLITFTLDGETLQAEENMTWATYVASKYNTKELTIFENSSVINDDGYEVEYNRAVVTITEKIVANGVYAFGSFAVPS